MSLLIIIPFKEFPIQPGNTTNVLSLQKNCIYKPFSTNSSFNMDDITLSVSFDFSRSYDTSATYQFDGINITTIQFGETINFGDPQFANQTNFFFYVSPNTTLQGGLIYMNTSSLLLADELY